MTLLTGAYMRHLASMSYPPLFQELFTKMTGNMGNNYDLLVKMDTLNLALNIYTSVLGASRPAGNWSCPESTRRFDQCVILFSGCLSVVAEWLARWLQQWVSRPQCANRGKISKYQITNNPNKSQTVHIVIFTYCMYTVFAALYLIHDSFNYITDLLYWIIKLIPWNLVVLIPRKHCYIIRFTDEEM